MILFAVGKRQRRLTFDWLVIGKSGTQHKNIKINFDLSAFLLNNDHVLVCHLFELGLDEGQLRVSLNHFIVGVQDPIHKVRVHSRLNVGAEMLKILVLVYYSHIVVVPDLLGESKACIREPDYDEGLPFRLFVDWC